MYARLAVGLLKPALLTIFVASVLSLVGVDVSGLVLSFVDQTAGAFIDWLLAELSDRLTDW
jgi:hypothetical protein